MQYGVADNGCYTRSDQMCRHNTENIQSKWLQRIVRNSEKSSDNSTIVSIRREVWKLKEC